jgi:hypothetical protein
MKRSARALAIVALAAPLLGMGALGGGGGGAPERNYEAAFVDRDGKRVEAKWVSAGGELALTGELGRGTLRVPFDDIAKVTFKGDDRKALVAAVELKKGEPVELEIRSSLSFTGQTAVGQYRIRARDLASVEFSAK